MHAISDGNKVLSVSIFVLIVAYILPDLVGASVERLQSAKLRRWQYEDTHMAFINAPLLGCYQAGVVSNSMIAW